MLFRYIFYLMFIGLLCSCEDFDFKSLNHPPNAPSNPSPTGTTTIAPTLSWTCIDPDGDALTYDVYFGTSSNPTTTIATGQTATSIARSGLSYSTTYYWKIVAKDSKGANTAGSIWSFTTGAQPNNPPNSPSNPSPLNGATDQATSLTLTWTCSDPDGDALTYDVYFGTSSNPTTTIATGQTATSIARSGLSNGTTYYWKIVARDNKNATTTGPVWSFSTAATPNTLTITSPNGGENWMVGTGQNITWTSTGSIANVNLDYSTNGGSSWISILTSTPNDGSQSWTVPNAPSTTCKVRVTDVSNSAITDMSNANFTISSGTGTVTDIDGNVYNTITIGTQTWMVQNLKTTRYRNGDVIANVTDNTAWSNLTTGAYCDYSNTPSNSNTYGRLYNWYAVTNSNNIAPAGWHVPTDTDWKTLEMYLGMTQQQADATGWRGTDEGNKLKEAGNSHWASPSAGTNSSGFTALPGGYRIYNGTFDNMGNYGSWWSSTEYDASNAWTRILYYNYADVNRNYTNKKDGFSVRCVRDN